MGEAQRGINPWVLHIQKLGLELKCALCLQLFNQPILLPCNHIFCSLCMPKAAQLGSECPACNHQYVDRDVKPASFMDNIVTIYRNINATFKANVIHPACSDVSRQGPASFKMDARKNLKKENVEIAQEGDSSNGQSMALKTPEIGQKQEFKMSGGDKPSLSNSMGQVMPEKHMQTCVDEMGFIRLRQFSPPLYRDSKVMDGNCSDSKSSHLNAVRYSPKRPVEDDADGTYLEPNNRCTSGVKCQTIEVKRKKKTNDELNNSSLEINGHSESNALASENIAATSSGKPLSGGQSSVDLDPMFFKRGTCAFCHSSTQTDGSGPLLSFAEGKEVVGHVDVANLSKVTYVHEKCFGWTPRIFFKDEIIQNLESEVARASKLKCSSCGKKGAGLGCYMKSCQNTYHVPCAYYNFDCRWDCDAYLLLCPKHASYKFPNEKKLKAGKQDTLERISTYPNQCTTTLNAGKNLVLCGSALSTEEKCFIIDFARSRRAIMSKNWGPNVTHVIAATDSDGDCTRTFKVLMAILNGKWILTVEWIKACVEAGSLVDEQPYEVNLDNHGCFGGPKAGRLQVLNNAPKLFNNLKFYFSGDFAQAFKTNLLNLVTTAGGTTMETKDQLLSSSDVDRVTLIVYNSDFSNHFQAEDEESLKFQRVAAAEDIARESGSQIVGHSWILESVAACSLLPFTSRP